jgi:hypothetical protein
MKRISVAAVLAALLAAGLWRCSNGDGAAGPGPGLGPGPSGFTCEGKTTCGQMASCNEALFYLENCPGVQIDGDSDGVPCEAQWCGH